MKSRNEQRKYSSLEVDEKVGLTSAQLEIRRNEKAYNRSKKYKGRSHLAILVSYSFNMYQT